MCQYTKKTFQTCAHKRTERTAICPAALEIPILMKREGCAERDPRVQMLCAICQDVTRYKTVTEEFCRDCTLKRPMKRKRSSTTDELVRGLRDVRVAPASHRAGANALARAHARANASHASRRLSRKCHWARRGSF